MSKGVSGWFSRTTGEGRALIDQIVNRGQDKITPDEVVGITTNKSGTTVWLEKGHTNGNAAGLAHIIDRHASQFNDIGIESIDIADCILTTVSQNEYNSSGIYEMNYKGIKHKIKIIIGSNGYIVTAFPM